jgi:hypothetical protein
MAAYPKRQSHWAHKLVRLMLHSCAAQEIGPDGFTLVVAIAHAEDAKRYSAPVTYWNEQLIPILGFNSWGQLDRARKKAIDGGWLNYEAGGKGKVGKYWTLCPDSLADAPDVSTEADHHVILSNSGEDNVKETWKKRERNVREPGDKRGRSGEHPTLALSLPLNTTPPALSLTPAADEDAEEDAATAKTGRKATKTDRTTSDVTEDGEPAGDEMTLTCPPANAQERPPARLRTWPAPDGCSDVIREAVDLWQAYRLAEDGKITPHVRIDLMLQDAWRKGWTDEQIRASVEFSIAKGAKNWKDPANDFDAPQAVSESPKARGKSARVLDSGSNPF